MKPRKTRAQGRFKRLGKGLEQRLAAYAAAAGAAGVGMLALASPAQADIVYTPANIRIPQTSDGLGVKIDLNHDGINDFSFWIWSYADFGPYYIDLFLWAHNRANGAEGGPQGFAARLESGVAIGSSQKFAQANQGFGGVPILDMKVNDTGAMTSFCFGPWVKPQNDRYVGVVFDVGGENHYGWVRLTTAGCVGGKRLEAIITGYAYNTEPNQPIVAGDEGNSPDRAALRSGSGTLGQLALGSLGLDLWRREWQPVAKRREFAVS
jgi:hypothetical protein